MRLGLRIRPFVASRVTSRYSVRNVSFVVTQSEGNLMYLRLIPVCAFLAINVAAAQSPAADPRLAEALEAFQRARKGDAREVERAVSAFERLAQAEPQQPLYSAYLGSAISMKSRDAWMPWNKIKYAEQGLARIDQALAALKPEDDARTVRGVPVGIETRFVAASTFLKVPDEIFHRRAQGEKLIAALPGQPAFAQTPAGLRAAIHLKAAEIARERGRAGDEAAQLKGVLAASQTGPEAEQASARLKELGR
jgi:hypothetical protein